MSQSNIPNMTPLITVSRDNAINLLLSSIALEEIGLSHIINAEGEKIQYSLGTLSGITSPPTSISDVLLVNQSVRDTNGLMQESSISTLNPASLNIVVIGGLINTGTPITVEIIRFTVIITP